MKSLADQLREQLVSPPNKLKAQGTKKEPADHAKTREKPVQAIAPIMEAIAAFDNSQNKTMVHVRFDRKTADTMNKFKMATNIDVTKFVAFAVKNLFETHPELKTIIKQFIQNTEL